MGKNKRVNRDRKSTCLGQITKKYCMHCSEECPKAGICVMIAMGCYLRQVVREPSPEESIDN
ncbi:MAG: hypothetical protein NTV15_05125 [Candidatus Bathyarchaeota archaeon]|nr:hypothetical protein [Candidatus Bathyarchaeota archaeon]